MNASTKPSQDLDTQLLSSVAEKMALDTAPTEDVAAFELLARDIILDAGNEPHDFVVGFDTRQQGE